jgi:hypothetical protein
MFAEVHSLVLLFVLFQFWIMISYDPWELWRSLVAFLLLSFDPLFLGFNRAHHLFRRYHSLFNFVIDSFSSDLFPVPACLSSH